MRFNLPWRRRWLNRLRIVVLSHIVRLSTISCHQCNKILVEYSYLYLEPALWRRCLLEFYIYVIAIFLKIRSQKGCIVCGGLWAVCLIIYFHGWNRMDRQNISGDRIWDELMHQLSENKLLCVGVSFGRIF